MSREQTAPTVLITGVSSGLGWGLAQEYLDRGWDVYGVSRREPADLTRHANFHFASVDLARHDDTARVLSRLLGGLDELRLAILNAGVLSPFGDMGDRTLAELKDVMEINLWANKTILDLLFERIGSIAQVVAISSGASVSGNRGWNGYSLSKAALNMLVRLYAAERPGTHFCALAPGIIDTAMQAHLSGIAPDQRYPTLQVLQSKRGTAEMPEPKQAAPRLIDVMRQLPERRDSGSYVDVRDFDDPN